jgi:catechol 2,3-dioxygenase-like lactoylglutathione lyase family enzyme
MQRALLASTATLLLLLAPEAGAQLAEGSVVYGHHHLYVSDVAEHKRFWTDTLGGTPIKFATTEVARFPGVLVFMTERAPTGGTVGTTVNHVGFSVPDVRATVDKVRAAGFRVATREELPPTIEVQDGVAAIGNQNTRIAMLMGPDNVKVELVENTAQTIPIRLHHVHFASDKVQDMRAWYVDHLGAVPGTRGQFQTADLPGVNLAWMEVAETPQGTQGTALDHIGFEVDNLEAFCKKLEAQGVKFDRPYLKVEALKVAVAFFTDPYGTYIELTEGLDQY